MYKFAFLTAVLVAPVHSFGAPITLGSLASKNIAVLGFSSAFSTGNVLVTVTGGSTFSVSGDVVSPSVGSGLTYTTGSAVTSGTELTNAEADFASLLSQLGALSFSALTITPGAVNNISTPGNYTLSTATLGAGTVINITTPGQYVFNSGGNLSLTGVTINGLGAGPSDNVFWYLPSGVFNITNSKVYGDVVQAGAGNGVLQTSGGGSGSITGRLLSGGFNTSLTAVQNSVASIGAAAVPEPSEFGIISLALGYLAFAVRRRKTL